MIIAINEKKHLKSSESMQRGEINGTNQKGATGAEIDNLSYSKQHTECEIGKWRE